MSDHELLLHTEDDTDPIIYRTYKRRWFYLFIVCLAQISNAIVGSKNEFQRISKNVSFHFYRFGLIFLLLQI